MIFEKVSFDVYRKELEKFGIIEKVKNSTYYETNKKDYTDTELIWEIYSSIKIPTRATTGSAGYDFYTPFSFDIKPQHRPVFIPTGIRAKIDTDKVLLITPRSSSSKGNYMMANTVGVIDSDYYNADNQGDIIISLVTKDHDETSFKAFKTGERIAQGLFLQFYTVENDITESNHRTGGFGSTGK